MNFTALYSLARQMLILLLLCPVLSFSQNYKWLLDKPLDYELNPTMLNYQVTGNSAGEVYWIGISEVLQFYGIITFGDQFIEHLDQDGNVLETSSITGKSFVVDLVCDANSDLYVLLNIKSDVLFDDGDVLTFTGSSYGSFIVKLDGISGIEWSKTFIGYSEGRCLAIDNDGNLLVGSDDYGDSYLTAYSPSGELLYEIEQLNVPVISSVDIDQDGNVYTTGSCAGTDAMYAGTQFENPFSYSKYLAKYNPQFEAEWVKYIEDITCTFPEVVCQEENQVYWSGDLFIPTQFDSISVPGPSWVFDFFLAKLDASGVYQWVKDVSEESTGDATINGKNFLSVDAQNNVCISGYTRGTVEWSDEITTVTEGYGYDALAVAYSETGEVTWVVSGGGNSMDQTFGSYLDDSGNLYLTGFGTDTLMFGAISSYQDWVHPFLVSVQYGTSVSVADKKTSNSHVNIYPNPFSDWVTVEVGGHSKSVSEINICDVSGVSLVRKSELTNKRAVIDLSSLSAGVYFIEVKTVSGERSFQKVIKQ
ncbi:MAG: T9SS type A sorting domain-containing protein [Bacteroidales bacterium]|nr:T9SS type A sorting domain-containing protein [Bacteroidales bacterium]